MTTEDSSTAQSTAAHSAQDTSTSTATEGSSQSAKSYTQAEIDTMMGERAKRAHEATMKKFLGALGLASEADLEPLKQTIAKAKERDMADMTESQKAQAERDTAMKKAETLQAQLDAERASIRQDRVTMAFSSAAVALKANNVGDVLRYARDQHADALSDVTDSEGKVDAKKLTTLLDKIKAERLDYFTPAATIPGSMSNHGGRTTPDTTKVQQTAQRDTYRQIKSGF